MIVSKCSTNLKLIHNYNKAAGFRFDRSEKLSYIKFIDLMVTAVLYCNKIKMCQNRPTSKEVNNDCKLDNMLNGVTAGTTQTTHKVLPSSSTTSHGLALLQTTTPS